MSSYHSALAIPVYRSLQNKKPHSFPSVTLSFLCKGSSWLTQETTGVGSVGSWGSAHRCLKTSSEQRFPRNWMCWENRPGCCRSDPHCRGCFISVCLFFLSDGYKTNGLHFSFSLVLLRRNGDIGISLNSLHLCSESWRKHPAKFQERNWRQLWKGRCCCLFYRVIYSLQ